MASALYAVLGFFLTALGFLGTMTLGGIAAVQSGILFLAGVILICTGSILHALKLHRS